MTKKESALKQGLIIMRQERFQSGLLGWFPPASSTDENKGLPKGKEIVAPIISDRSQQNGPLQIVWLQK